MSATRRIPESIFELAIGHEPGVDVGKLRAIVEEAILDELQDDGTVWTLSLVHVRTDHQSVAITGQVGGKRELG